MRRRGKKKNFYRVGRKNLRTYRMSRGGIRL